MGSRPPVPEHDGVHGCGHAVTPTAAAGRRDIVVTMIATFALLAWDLSGADLLAVRQFGDGHGFAWRDAWLTRTVLHQGGRALAWAALAALAVHMLRPTRNGAPQRERRRWFLAACTCLFVPALKRASRTSCPWDLAEFGGVASYVSHWSWGRDDGGAGHCFPSGHAVAAFAFFSGYFMLRTQRPILARLWLTAVLLIGAAFGLAQLSRGAHYPSHTLWSAWMCWVICVIFDRMARRQVKRREPGLPVRRPDPRTARPVRHVHR
jgi:membrane-associated PAP2 superfamily phosphatase